MKRRATIDAAVASPAGRAYDVMRQLGEESGSMSKLLTAKLRVSRSGRYYFRPEIDKIGGKARPRIWCPAEVQLEGVKAVRIWHARELQKFDRKDYTLQADMPFGAFLDEFLRRHVKATRTEGGVVRSKLGAGTQAKYETLIRVHVRPAFAGKRLCDITLPVLQEWLDHRQLASATKASLKALMCTMFEKAADWNLWADRNPAERIEVGRHVPVYQRGKLTIDEQQRLMAALPEDVRLICMVALICTFRISEVLGLQEKHVDYERGILHVRQRWYRGSLDLTKSVKSERDAPCAGIIEELRRRRTGDPEAFVFSVRTYQTRRLRSGEVRQMERPRISRDDRDINQHFLRPAAKALGVYRPGFGFHAFRREAITEIGRAIGIQQAQAAAGHASAGMTQHYTLSDLPAQERVAEERLALLLGKPEGRVS